MVRSRGDESEPLIRLADIWAGCIGLMADRKAGEPRVQEPDKCYGWLWYAIDDLPSPPFGVISNSLEAYKGGGLILIRSHHSYEIPQTRTG